MAGRLTYNAGNAAEHPATAYGAACPSSHSPEADTPTHRGASPGSGPSSIPSEARAAYLLLQTTDAGVGSKPAPPAKRGAGGGVSGRSPEAAAGGPGAQPYLDTPHCEHLDIETPQSREDVAEERHWRRLAKRERAKKHLAASLKDCDRLSEWNRVRNCGEFLRLMQSGCGVRRLTPIRCDHMLCPDCCLERVKPLWERVRRIFDGHSRGEFRFITLTVPNVPRIDREYIDGLTKAFRKLRRRGVWKATVAGGIYAFDTTYNRATETWNVHIHAIIQLHLDVPGYVKADGYTLGGWLRDVKADWEAVSGGQNVHVRRVTHGAIKELLKYSAKAASFVYHAHLVDEYLTAFENVRRIQSWGTFLGAAKDEEKPPAPSCKCGDCDRSDWQMLGVIRKDQCMMAENGEWLLIDDWAQLKRGSPPTQSAAIN